MRPAALSLGCALLSSAAFWSPAAPCTEEASIAVRGPMACSRGPDVQYFEARTTLPDRAPTGSVYTVRIDSVPSAKVSGAGLNYLHDLLTDYALPSGAAYVDGSAHVVSGTGSENLRAGARVWQEGGFLRVLLPGHVDNGTSFTPPSVEFQLEVTAAPGATLPIQFARHRLRANVFLLGNLEVVCTPRPARLTIGTTVVTPSPS